MKSNELSQELNDKLVENNNDYLIEFNPDLKLGEIDLIESNEFIDFNPDKRAECLNLENCIMMFEQSNWDSLDANEIDVAITKLKDIIALDLGLENVPDIGYYFENNEYDCGTFSTKDNKIYLNCYHLDFPDKIIKTIVHELRHCWQIEQINLPEELQNDFTKVLKFNDENYINPYDNYCAYWNQPMEVDARLYSEKVLSSLF